MCDCAPEVVESEHIELKYVRENQEIWKVYFWLMYYVMGKVIKNCYKWTW